MIAPPVAGSTRLQPTIIWGARGHAKVLHEFLPQLGYRVLAVFDNDIVDIPPLNGVPVYRGMDGFQEWRSHCDIASVQALVAIGGPRGGARLQIQQRLAELGIPPLTVIHPSAYVAGDASLGDGCQILAHATVCTEVTLGESCIINTKASVDHESVLGDGVHIAPGATITGCVTIGDGSMIAAGAVVLPRIKIGRRVIVGAGSVVTRDIPDGKVVYGSPARIIRDNDN